MKGDELGEAEKLFGVNENMPKIYYYISKVKGEGVDKNGKPYEYGNINSVTILSYHDNKTNKNYQVLLVFRKDKEGNEKKVKDESNYYFILGSKLNKDDLPELSSFKKYWY